MSDAVTCTAKHATGDGHCVYCRKIQHGRAEGERAATERIVKFMRRPSVRNEDASGRFREARFVERGMHNETETGQ